MTKKADTTPADDDPPADPAREGITHLQQAAKELIAAGRSLLDAVEELVEDPAAVGQLGDTLASLAKLGAGALAGLVPQPPPPDGDGGSRVQRIKVG